MNDALEMSGVHRTGQRGHEAGGGAGVLPLVPGPLMQAAAIDKLEREVRPAVVLADLVNLHDVRVLQMSDRLRLAAEAGQFARASMGARQHHLQSDHPLELEM